MEDFKCLQTGSMANVVLIHRPERHDKLDKDSPALELLTDFTTSEPPMLERGTRIDDAEAIMSREHVSLKLVIDHLEQFCGLITQLDIRSSRLMKVAVATGIPRADLTVDDVMTRRSDLHSVDFADFQRTNVGRVLSTMKQLGDRHLLVVDTGGQRLRGIVTARDIAMRLNTPDDISERANTFADIFTALSH